ncbi:hypothetical protein KSP39_PZI012552 [Platanthera zijinensis]|uniref:Uncharacterized protein n=1 Tax=Platanthera zijinensis TaxID=2320716 RepID=A0AAP0G508_9ASPA
MRALLLLELKKLIVIVKRGTDFSKATRWAFNWTSLTVMNSLFLGKLQFPKIKMSRLKALISQSSKICKQTNSQNPMPEADGTTNFLDCVGALPTAAALNMTPTHGGLIRSNLCRKFPNEIHDSISNRLQYNPQLQKKNN